MLLTLTKATIVATLLTSTAAEDAVPMNPSNSGSPIVLVSGDQIKGLSQDVPRATAPSTPGLVANLLSDQRTPHDAFEDELAALKQRLRRDEETIKRLLDEIGDLSAVTIEEAYAAAEELIGIGQNFERLLEENGAFDERIKDARAFCRGLGQAISESPHLSESLRDQLLDNVNRKQAALTVEISRLLEMREVVRALTKKTRASREYLAFAHQVMVGGEILEKIQELNDTLSDMAAVLRQLIAEGDAPVS